MTKAIYDFWEYYEPVREYGPPDCILATQKLTNIVDNILLGKNNTRGLIKELKTAFGLQDIQYVLNFFFFASRCGRSADCGPFEPLAIRLVQKRLRLETSLVGLIGKFPLEKYCRRLGRSTNAN